MRRPSTETEMEMKSRADAAAADVLIPAAAEFCFALVRFHHAAQIVSSGSCLTGACLNLAR